MPLPLSAHGEVVRYTPSHPTPVDRPTAGIYHGGPAGLGPVGFTEEFTIPDGHFGFAIAAVDFEGLGHPTWLAIGAPGGRATPNPESGIVYLYEWDGGWSYQTYFAPGVDGVYGGNAPYDHFGAALAVGDFDNDGHEDLAASAPDKRHYVSSEVGSIEGAGSVHVFNGSPSGATTWANDWVHANNFGALQADAHFGTALAGGDFDGDGYDDLAIGAPDHDLETPLLQENAGAVWIVYGKVTGIWYHLNGLTAGTTRRRRPRPFPDSDSRRSRSGQRQGEVLDKPAELLDGRNRA